MTAPAQDRLARRGMHLFVFALMTALVASAPLVAAGTSTNPEIRDSPTDSERTLGTVSQPLEIRKGWIEPKDDILHFTIELSGAPEVPPEDAVYTWHFTWGAFRFYWMLNTTADGPTYSGGVYQGSPNSDRFGSTRYIYLPGNAGDNLTGEFIGGPNARIIWKYDVNNFGKPGEEPILFSGMSIHSYLVEDRSLTMIDAASGEDYLHIVLRPWHERLWNQIPGPSPFVIVAAAAGLLAVAARRRA